MTTEHQPRHTNVNDPKEAVKQLKGSIDDLFLIINKLNASNATATPKIPGSGGKISETSQTGAAIPPNTFASYFNGVTPGTVPYANTDHSFKNSLLTTDGASQTTVGGSTKLQFNNENAYIYSSSNAILQIVSDYLVVLAVYVYGPDAVLPALQAKPSLISSSIPAVFLPYVKNTLLKADGNGEITAAISGVDYDTGIVPGSNGLLQVYSDNNGGSMKLRRRATISDPWTDTGNEWS
jgi:hypothetical protein